MVFQGFLPVDKDIIKSKCHRNVRGGIKNAAEMLQNPDISAENLPLTALSAHCCKKIYAGQLGISVCHVLSYREHHGKFRTPARLRSYLGWIKSELFTDFHLQGENVREEMAAYRKFFNSMKNASPCAWQLMNASIFPLRS